jgi:hypothetical protein
MLDVRGQSSKMEETESPRDVCCRMKSSFDEGKDHLVAQAARGVVFTRVDLMTL